MAFTYLLQPGNTKILLDPVHNNEQASNLLPPIPFPSVGNVRMRPLPDLINQGKH